MVLAVDGAAACRSWSWRCDDLGGTPVGTPVPALAVLSRGAAFQKVGALLADTESVRVTERRTSSTASRPPMRKTTAMTRKRAARRVRTAPAKISHRDRVSSHEWQLLPMALP